MIPTIMLLILFGLILSGVPIFVAMGFAGFAHYFVEGAREGILIVYAQRFFAILTSFPFLAVPMFMFAGKIMGATGITDRLIDLAGAFIGHFKGGLAQTNIFASILFASISGSANADVAAIGSALIPAMEDEGYHRGFAGALTAASAALSPIFPPSIVLVIYGATFGVSIGGLFAAGIGISLLMMIGQIILTTILSKINDFPTRERVPWSKKIYAFRRAILPLIMPIIILGGIFSGIFTATEASTVAVAYALILGGLIYRSLSIKSLINVIKDTAYTTGALLIIAGMANVLSYVVARRNIPRAVMGAMLLVTDNPIGMVLLICSVLIIAGLFIGRTSNVLLFTPIVAPIFYELGFSEIHTGIAIVMTLGIGHLTPPVGTTLLATCLVGKIKMETLVKYVWPYIILDIVVAGITIFFTYYTELFPRLLGYL